MNMEIMLLFGITKGSLKRGVFLLQSDLFFQYLFANHFQINIGSKKEEEKEEGRGNMLLQIPL